MIELININKTYKPKKGAKVNALNNINLTIGEKGLSSYLVNLALENPHF